MSDTTNVMVQDDRALKVAGHIVVAFGTTANAIAASLARSDPRIRSCLVGLDGEWNRHADAYAFTLSNGGEDDWQKARAWPTDRLLKHDRLLPQLAIPAQMGAGAGRHRVIGYLRYHTKRASFLTRVKDTARLALANNGNGGSRQRTVFRADFITTTVGGTGAGCMPIGALDTISAIRELIPNAHIWATAHLVGATCFEGLSREKERKMQRTTNGLLRELIYLQTAENLYAFADAVEVFWDDSRGQLLDEIVDYNGSDTRNVSFSLAETSSRIGQNIRAAFDPTWSSIRVEREGCNRNGRVDLTPQHIVTNAQANIAMIPLVLPKLYANRWLGRVIGPMLAKPEVSELTGEIADASAALNAEGGFKKATAGAYRQLGTALIEDAKAMPDQCVTEETITNNLERKLGRQHTLVLEYFASRVGKYVSRWVKELSKRHTSIGTLNAVIEQVTHRLGEAVSRAEAHAQQLEKQTSDGPIKKRGLFWSHSGLLDFLEARIDASRLKTAGEVIGLYAQAAKSWVEKLESLAESLRVLGIQARKEVADSEEAIAGDSASIVHPVELAGVHASLKAFLADRGESPPAVSLNAILDGDAASLLNNCRDKVTESVRRQLAGESVTSFAATLKLKFDLEGWLRERLRNLGGTSPLVPALLPPNDQEQTVIVAEGPDFTLVERMLQEMPRLRHELEAVRGTEPGNVLIIRGCDHAPIEGMAGFALSARAVAEFRRHYPMAGKSQKLPLDPIEASCGPLLPAQDGNSPGQIGALMANAPSAGPSNGRAAVAVVGGGR